MRFLILLIGLSSTLYGYEVNLSQGTASIDSISSSSPPIFQTENIDVVDPDPKFTEILTGVSQGLATQQNATTSTTTIQTQRDSDGNSITNITNNYTSSPGDSDDDVPTLITIRERIQLLEQSVNNTRGNKKEVTIDGNGDFIINNGGGQTTLSDIHVELQKLVSRDADNIEDIDQEREADVNDQIDDVEAENDTLEDNLITASITTPTPTSSSEYAHLYIPIKEPLSRFLKKDEIDLFNIGKFGIPSLATFAHWCSIVVGCVALFIFGWAIKIHVLETLENLPKHNESNAVTNYSLFGNSVGALGVFALKVTLVISYLALLYVHFANIVGIQITFDGVSLPWHNLFDNLISFLSQSKWGGYATYWFYKFIPLSSILEMAFEYLILRFFTAGMVLANNRAIRTAS